MDLLDSQHADELATLLALQSAGSFAAAGRVLQRHPSVLSKRLNALERRLGLLSGMLAEFAQAHPQDTLEVEYADRLVDTVGERFDAAVRIGTLADSRLVAIRLCGHQRIMAAAPHYLAQHGAPQAPADLARHNCLGFTGLLSYPEWQLVGEGTRHTVLVCGSLISNDNEALLTAATQGVGILAGGDWLIGPHIASGQLVRVLPAWQLDGDAGIYLVRPSARFSTAAMAAFREWIVGWFHARAA